MVDLDKQSVDNESTTELAHAKMLIVTLDEGNDTLNFEGNKWVQFKPPQALDAQLTATQLDALHLTEEDVDGMAVYILDDYEDTLFVMTDAEQVYLNGSELI